MNKHIVKAKNKHTREWIKGYYIESYPSWICNENDKEDYKCCFVLINPTHYDDEYGHAVIRNDLDSNFDTIKVDPDTVCRYLGLNDIENQPIFEYDIIETTHTGEIQNFGYYPVTHSSYVAPLLQTYTKQGVIRYHNKYKIGLAIFWNKGHMDINNRMTLFNCNGKVVGNKFDKED